MGLFMKKITIFSLWLIIVSVMMLGSFNSAMAHEHESGKQATSTIKGIRQDARQQIKEVKQSVKGEVKELKQNVRGEIKELRQNVREEVKQDRETIKKEFEAKRMEVKNLMEIKKEEFKNKVEAKREEVKSKIEAKKVELKERLTKIKDERKRQVVERIYNQINELNKRRLDHFSAVLEKLEKVLDRISGRSAKAEANGRDISAVKIAITEATNAIALSRTAIQNQAGKVYALIISTSTVAITNTSTSSIANTESVLKIDVGEIRKALHRDLDSVQKTVKTAQEAIRKAATTLAKIPKVDELEVEISTPATSTIPVIPGATTTQPVQ